MLATEVKEKVTAIKPAHLRMGLEYCSFISRLNKKLIVDFEKKAGCSMVEYQMVDYIHRAGEQKMTEISNLFSLSMSALTGVMDKLEEMGYLVRKRSTGDRRVIYVTLGPKVEHARRMHDEFFEGIAASILFPLTESEREQAISAWKKIMAYYNHESNHVKR